MKVRTAGFTLIEMLIVVTVIGILSAVIYGNFGESSAQSRDAKRKADLRLVQNAVELYKQEHGRYPEGCNGASGEEWSGEQGTNYACASSDSQYIVGLAPEYIPVLPKDPKKGSGDYGYVYRTNVDGTVYKFVARKSVESETFIDYTGNNGFMACDVVLDSTGELSQLTSGVNECTTWSEYISSQIPLEGSRCSLGVCNQYENGSGGYNRPAPECGNSDAGILTSYAVWGGYAEGDDASQIEINSERVLCDMPGG